MFVLGKPFQTRIILTLLARVYPGEEPKERLARVSEQEDK
jgi:hypothetical protein